MDTSIEDTLSWCKENITSLKIDWIPPKITELTLEEKILFHVGYYPQKRQKSLAKA